MITKKRLAPLFCVLSNYRSTIDKYLLQCFNVDLIGRDPLLRRNSRRDTCRPHHKTTEGFYALGRFLV